MPNTSAAKALPRKRALKSVPAPPVDEDFNLDLLRECNEHATEDGKQLLFFEDGQKPSDVLREAVEVVVAENNQRLAQGGFHRDLIFRSGKDSGQFVTLAKNEDGDVLVKPLTASNISLALQSRFCYLAGKKKPKSHRPMPGWFANALHYGDTEYRFPVLNGLLNHPAIHLDGTIVAKEGYDPVTKCWVVAGWDTLKVPARPSLANIKAAITTLREPFSEVIFKGDDMDAAGANPVKHAGADMTPSEANAIGLVLTAMLRRQMQTAPFFIITSSQWGTAKGLIASVASQIAQDDTPLLTDMKISPDQMEKNVDRVLHDHPGAQIIQFDEPQDSNSGGRFHSRKLALLATTDKYVNRPVYGHAAVSVNTQRTMIFTGINIRPDQDMVRRVSLIELDIPHNGILPHERTFAHPDRSDKVLLLRWVRERRREFIAAILTLVIAWRETGCAQADFSFDFPEWVHSVGGILQNAGITAWMSNRNDVYANADEALKAAFVLGVVEMAGVGPFPSRELSKRLSDHTDSERLMDMLTWDETWARKLHTAWGDDKDMTLCLGKVLSGMKDRLLSDGNGGRVTVSSYLTHGVPQWTFTTPGQPTPQKRAAGRKPKP